MVDLPVGELLVVRFSPFTERGLTEHAEDEYERLSALGETPIYSVSTFGLIREHSSHSIDEMIETICREAPCGGKNVCVTTRSALEDNGFRVQLSEPPRHHYDLVIGNELNAVDVKRLEGLLAAGRRRNPAWVK
ncbi:hypothetical protein ABT247_21195 [Kitasatospora sp. NPDC001539]|uniref:hypothetical protein n=1 Tax=Kitasatospora sp. NPDC001539 TaxID=3154384 RepID=UPI00331A4661